MTDVDRYDCEDPRQYHGYGVGDCKYGDLLVLQNCLGICRDPFRLAQETR